MLGTTKELLRGNLDWNAAGAEFGRLGHHWGIIPIPIIHRYKRRGTHPEDLVALNSFFWLVFKKGGDITVSIQPAGSLAMARLKAGIAGVEGEFQEGHELDRKMTKKVPKAQIGKLLSRKQATALLTKLR